MNAERKNKPGSLYLSVNLLVPSLAALFKYLQDYADWVRDNSPEQKEPKCETADQPTETTVRFIGEFCYDVRKDMWATILNTSMRIGNGRRSYEEVDGGAQWTLSDARPPKKQESTHTAAPIWFHWVDERRIMDRASLAAALRQAADALSKPEATTPVEGFSALDGRLPNEGALYFRAYFQLSGKERLLSLLNQTALEIEQGDSCGGFDAHYRWTIHQALNRAPEGWGEIVNPRPDLSNTADVAQETTGAPTQPEAAPAPTSVPTQSEPAEVEKTAPAPSRARAKGKI